MRSKDSAREYQEYDESSFNDINGNDIKIFSDNDTTTYEKDKEYAKEVKDNLTDEQRRRDKFISDILEQFVTNYKNKVEINKSFKKALFIFCLSFIGVFSLAALIAIIIIASKNNGSINEIVAFVSACATLIALPIGIFKIIVSYIFPASEEKEIANIVQLIQQNDLKNKKANLKALNEENGNVENIDEKRR